MLQAVTNTLAGTGRRTWRLRDDAAYAAALDKLTSLKSRLASLERRKNDLLGALSYTRRDDVTIRAEELLANPNGPGVGASEEAARTENRTELERAYDEMRILNRAIEMQSPLVEAERWRVSRGVAERRRPAHVAIVRRIIAAIEELDAVLVEEQQLLDEFEGGDVSLVTIRPAVSSLIGRLEDPNSRLSLWARELREYVEGR
jgi:hypothetical protein